MKKLIQTRIHKGFENLKDRGNCYPTVIACFLDLESPEDCIQIQEHYDLVDDKNTEWQTILIDWLKNKGWETGTMKGHLHDNSFYLVTGLSPRGVTHICIYKNGKLYHDPHPTGSGLKTEQWFEYFNKI